MDNARPARMRKILAEAATATSMEGVDQIEIQLGHFCNNRCVFCMSGQMTAMGHARPVDVAPILRHLEAAAERGVRRVTFLGGEPTIQKSFIAALDHAVNLGFNEIVIFTNGARGRSARFLASIVSRGQFIWRFSIQGGNAAAHDAVTMRVGSFDRIQKALTFLSACNADITANMCVNTLSYTSLPDFPALIRQYGIRQLHIDLVRPDNTGLRTEAHLRSIIPRVSEMAPYIRQMLEGFERWDPLFDVNIGNLPYCVLPEWAHKIHHGGEPTLIVPASREGAQRLLHKYDFQAIDAVYAPGCAGCVFRARCRGVTETYAHFYGTDELTPLTPQTLREHDPHQRSFAITEVETLLALTDHPPPDGWHLGELRANTNDRTITRSLTATDGATAVFTFAAPDDPKPRGPAAIRGARVVVTLHGVSGARRERLLRWGVARLSTHGQMEGLRIVDPEARERALRRALILARRLQQRTPIAGFAWGGLKPLPDSRGVRVLLRHPEKRSVVVRFVLNERLKVQVRFDRTDADRAAIEAICVALQAPVAARA